MIAGKPRLIKVQKIDLIMKASAYKKPRPSDIANTRSRMRVMLIMMFITNSAFMWMINDCHSGAVIKSRCAFVQHLLSLDLTALFSPF